MCPSRRKLASSCISPVHGYQPGVSASGGWAQSVQRPRPSAVLDRSSRCAELVADDVHGKILPENRPSMPRSERAARPSAAQHPGIIAGVGRRDLGANARAPSRTPSICPPVSGLSRSSMRHEQSGTGRRRRRRRRRSHPGWRRRRGPRPNVSVGTAAVSGRQRDHGNYVSRLVVHRQALKEP